MGGGGSVAGGRTGEKDNMTNSPRWDLHHRAWVRIGRRLGYQHCHTNNLSRNPAAVGVFVVAGGGLGHQRLLVSVMETFLVRCCTQAAQLREGQNC